MVTFFGSPPKVLNVHTYFVIGHQVGQRPAWEECLYCSP